MQQIKSIIISPPFGNHIQTEWATSVAGSYTVNPRSGLLSQAIKTIRPVKGGWVNKIGLRNPGLYSINYDRNKIYSLAALHEGDYDTFLEIVPSDIIIEINLGCPNTEVQPLYFNFRLFVDEHPLVIVKMPPPCVGYFYQWIYTCYSMGIRYFHLCNSLPTKRGGESGARLKKESLKAVEWTKTNLPDAKIIAGGGIYTPNDVQEYREAGADIFSLSTIFFTPWKVKKVVNEILTS